MSSLIDETKPVNGSPTTESVRSNFSIAKAEISELQDNTTGGPFLPLSGGQMTGPMYLLNDPTDGRMPATKDYVDVHGGGGGSGGIPEAPADGATYGRNTGAWVPALPLTGGALTGTLDVAGNGITYSSWPGHRIGFEWTGTALRMRVDGADSGTIARADQTLPLAGGTLTGLLTLSGPPTAALHAVTKAYVDAADALKAPLASPLFSGTPTAPTPAIGTATAQLATCGFVAAGFLPLAGGTVTGQLSVTGPVYSAGATAGFNFADRTATGNSFWWYATGGSAKLNYFPNGDIVEITTTGGIWAKGGVTVATVGSTDSDPLKIYGASYARARTIVAGVRDWSFGTWADAWWKLTDETGGQVRLGIDGAGSCWNASGTWNAFSDARLKEVTADYTTGLDAICQLRPVRFHYTGELGTDPAAEQIGLVAQEVEPIMPEIVTTTSVAPIDGEAEEVLGTAPGLLVYAMINALREVRDRLAALEGTA